ncbi:hypothetical protein RB2083_2885 [Rhodobacteraceae bacterium HTCC2083]|nr:hypothetical protein RB2083_2885 [Rhodobacteraceae bacterium HTCC2083]
MWELHGETSSKAAFYWLAETIDRNLSKNSQILSSEYF